MNTANKTVWSVGGTVALPFLLQKKIFFSRLLSVIFLICITKEPGTGLPGFVFSEDVIGTNVVHVVLEVLCPRKAPKNSEKVRFPKMKRNFPKIFPNAVRNQFYNKVDS